MYPIPGNNPQTNAPNNAVHGFFSYAGFTNSAVADTEHLFYVPEGVYIIWCTLIGAGNCGVNATQDSYIGPSNNPFFKCPGQVAGTVAGGSPAGQFSSLGKNGQSGYTNGTVTRGGGTPLGHGGDDNNPNANLTGFGAGGAALGGAPWFWRVPLFVVPGQVIPYFTAPIAAGSNPQGSPAYVAFEW